MKVKLLPLAIGAAIAMPGVAMAETNFYGKINVAYGMSDADTGNSALDPSSSDRWELESYDSRFGVKGAEAINDSLKAIYQIEWEVNFDDGADIKQRDRFVGFEGGFGTFKAGKFDSPLKKAQGKIDLFGDTTGDIKHIFVGENRLDNVLQYSTPDMGGLQANIAFAPGEEYETSTNSDPKDGPADAISLSLTYSMDNMYFAVAHDSEVASSAYDGIVDTTFELSKTAAVDMDVTRLVGVVDMDAIQVGAMYQMAETSDADNDGDLEQDGYLLSGSFKMDAIKLKAQWGTSTVSDNDNNVDTDAELVALGADYGLSKQTNFYAHYTMFSVEEDSAGANEETFDRLDVGVIHKF